MNEISKNSKELPQYEFALGSSVIYGIKSGYKIASIEKRQLDGKSIAFYKLEVKRPVLGKTNHSIPSIWVPVEHAKARGLRNPMNAEEALSALEILLNREYYFDLKSTPNELQKAFDHTLKSEGAFGVAKVASFLFVAIKKQVLYSPEHLDLSEQLQKMLLKEISQALPSELDLEVRIQKGLKGKLSPNQ